MLENCQNDPKLAQILSTRPSQYLPAQIQNRPIEQEPAQSGNTGQN